MKYGQSVAQIETALDESGPLTRNEIQAATGIPKASIGSILTRMRRPGKTVGQRIYIEAWTREQDGQRTYPRAVYALGDSPDAMQPTTTRGKNGRKLSSKQVSKATYDAANYKQAVSSVFDLALNRDERNAKIRRLGASLKV